MSSRTQPQAGSVTAEAPAASISERWQGMGSALIFGALLGALYGALMGLCVAGMFHALNHLSFDAHGNHVRDSGQDVTNLYLGGALGGAALGAISLMLLSGGLVLLLDGIQQLWRGH